MYKNEEKQREANAERQRRYREKDKALHGKRRGKDIKCFADLPYDVRATIDRLSADEQEHNRRTGIAISYQHTFPDRYYSTGCC
ncbi:MAG: hypothetical protein MUO31_06735 [Thermodesulfovibrionales bacterium]|nr:hypothetical protein [Thermodesulfovibrionales bacterium]